jgi:hypothetical protein
MVEAGCISVGSSTGGFRTNCPQASQWVAPLGSGVPQYSHFKLVVMTLFLHYHKQYPDY